ncbi:hypothetical protein GI374_14855 [Paracoccus sp. S-4012]|nr:hypothetical protein [Paracoccus sp. S-4012]
MRYSPSSDPAAGGASNATIEWVDWFNRHRLLGTIGNFPPAQAEANLYAALGAPAMAVAKTIRSRADLAPFNRLHCARPG